MSVTSLDHLVLTVASIDASLAFYENVLGMHRQTFGENRVALVFGQQKINLHPAGGEFQPHAERPTPGSADLCFLVNELGAMTNRINKAGVEILQGPVERTGATGPIRSVYIRDPDNNLIEVSEPISKTASGDT